MFVTKGCHSPWSPHFHCLARNHNTRLTRNRFLGFVMSLRTFNEANALRRSGCGASKYCLELASPTASTLMRGVMFELSVGLGSWCWMFLVLFADTRLFSVGWTGWFSVIIAVYSELSGRPLLLGHTAAPWFCRCSASTSLSISLCAISHSCSSVNVAPSASSLSGYQGTFAIPNTLSTEIAFQLWFCGCREYLAVTLTTADLLVR